MNAKILKRIKSGSSRTYKQVDQQADAHQTATDEQVRNQTDAGPRIGKVH